jgi:hypothetical protein
MNVISVLLTFCQVVIGGTVWDLRMPSVILQHVDALSNAHIVPTADPGVSVAYTLDARSQVPHEPGLQRHVQVFEQFIVSSSIITLSSDAGHERLLQHVRALRRERSHGFVCVC